MSSGFGAGHSLTLCSAAANARKHKVHHRRITHVRASIDASVPHSLLRNFDDSKGKLQKKLEDKYKAHADKVTQERIHKLNQRCPIEGETLHDKLVGGSFHSPPKRARDSLDRANKYYKDKRKKAIITLEKKNQIIAERLQKVVPTKISRRHGSSGWERHWNKHSHWQHLSEKRRTLMQKMINAKLGAAADSSSRTKIKTETKNPAPPGEFLQPFPPPAVNISSIKHKMELHYEKMQKTKQLSPVLHQNVVNPTTMNETPVFQEYINRMSIAEKTVFDPHAPPRKNINHFVPATIDPATLHIPHRPNKQNSSQSRRNSQNGKGGRNGKVKRKNKYERKKRTRKRENHTMTSQKLTLSQEKLAKMDLAWERKTKVQQNSHPTWKDVMSVQSGMDRVHISRWHDGILEATFDPYMSTDGPGWRCDVCNTAGTGLVYHDHVHDVDICLKCTNMARRLDWVEVADKLQSHDESKNQGNLKKKKSIPSLNLGAVQIAEEEDVEEEDDGTTWLTFKPNQPNSPINITSPFASIDDVEQRDQIVYRCGMREHNIHSGKDGSLLLLTILRSPDGLLLSEDRNGSLLIDVYDIHTQKAKRSILMGSDMICHPKIGANGVRLLMPSTASNNRRPTITSGVKIAAENVIQLLDIDPITRDAKMKVPKLTEQQKQKIAMKCEKKEKERAAVVMQNSYRGARARNTTKRKRKEKMLTKIQTKEDEKNMAASRLQARFRGTNDRKKVNNMRQQKKEFTRTQSKQRQKSRNQKEQQLFPGEIGKVFCTKGIFFDTVRVFGLVSVQIFDGATKADIKRKELAANSPSRENKKAIKPKRRASVRRQLPKKIIKNDGSRKMSSDRKKEQRQLLFSVYLPTTSQFYHIKVQKQDVEAMFDSREHASVIVNDPTSLSNHASIVEMVDMIHIEYTQLGFGGAKTLKAYMSREEPHVLMEEEIAATKLQTRWRGEQARRLISERKILVRDVHCLLNTIHERGGEDVMIDLKHSRVELLTNIAFNQQWREAYKIAARSNKHVNAHPEVLGRRNVQLLVPRVATTMLCLLREKDDIDRQEDAAKKKSMAAGNGTHPEDASEKMESEKVEELKIHSNDELTENNERITGRASESEKRAACRAIFHRVDTDMSGYIDAEELVQLLTNLTDELQLKSNLQEITINEAEYFIDSMDADVSFLLFDVFFFLY